MKKIRALAQYQCLKYEKNSHYLQQKETLGTV